MKTVIVTIAIFVLLALLAFQSLIASDVRNSHNFLSAQRNFIHDAAATSCLAKAEMIMTAISRDWEYRDIARPDNDIKQGQEYRDILIVHVKPPRNFAKDLGVKFFFDAKGCLAPSRF